jgi:DNA-binding transcriptional LysR family regulator
MREIEHFLAVADELHFGRAAQKCYIAQPALSRSIQTLEKRIGVELFVRSSREVVLTDAGRALLDDARTFAQHGNRLLERARFLRTGEVGELAAGYIPMVQELAADVIMSFGAVHPSASVTHRRAYDEIVRTGVADGVLDVGMVLGIAHSDPLVAVRFDDVPLVCIVGHEHPLAHRQKVAPSDLVPYPVLTMAGHGRRAQREALAPAFAQHSVDIASFEFVEMQDPIARVPEALLRSGHELMWLASRQFGYVAPDLATVEVDPPLTWPIDVVIRGDNTKPSAQLFIEHIRMAPLDKYAAAGSAAPQQSPAGDDAVDFDSPQRLRLDGIGRQ